MTTRPNELSTVELLRMHKSLHREHGDSKELPGAVVELERALATEMKSRGFPPRHVDTLADAAGTLPDTSTPAPTLNEVQIYVAQSQIGLSHSAVTLSQAIKTNKLYLGVASPVLRPIASSILKAVQREMPPGVEIDLNGDTTSDEYLRTRALYALQLVPSRQRDVIITTAKSMAASFQDAAAAASRVFKTGATPGIPFKVSKQESHEQIVSGVVLEPEAPDATKTEESDADIYSAEEIHKAMIFWMENARSPFTYQHVELGGHPLSPEDVVLLENWQARADFIEGEQAIRKGTWMLTTRVRHPGLWQDIISGKINSWSLGLECLAGFEEAA